MKRGILSFRTPPAHKYRIIALQNSTNCRFEFTATAVVECFLRGGRPVQILDPKRVRKLLGEGGGG